MSHRDDIETAAPPPAASPLYGADNRLIETATQKRKAPCPTCGAGPERRRASAGFGVARPMCGACGYLWETEVWRG